MKDYNDGNWHGWNGGECPVHPNTDVEYLYLSGGTPVIERDKARLPQWDAGHPMPLVAFRVTKEHKEPREFWLGFVCVCDDPKVLDAQPDDDGFYDRVIHVREVLE